MHEDRSHLAPGAVGAALQGSQNDKSRENHEKIFGKWKPSGTQGKIRKKSTTVDVNHTTSAKAGVCNETYRNNLDRIFKRNKQESTDATK